MTSTCFCIANLFKLRSQDSYFFTCKLSQNHEFVEIHVIFFLFYFGEIFLIPNTPQFMLYAWACLHIRFIISPLHGWLYGIMKWLHEFEAVHCEGGMSSDALYTGPAPFALHCFLQWWVLVDSRICLGLNCSIPSVGRCIVFHIGPSN